MVILSGGSFDDVISAFAYKPRSPPLPLPNASSPLARPARGRRRGGKQEEPEVEEGKAPNEPPPLLNGTRRKRTPSGLTSVASPSVRTAADQGPIRVVSRFFPLPPQAAFSRVVTDGKNQEEPEVEEGKAPNELPPLLNGTRRKRTPSGLTSVASPSVRTAADRGPIRVVSRFFPLPPQAAFSRVVTDGKNQEEPEVEEGKAPNEPPPLLNGTRGKRTPSGLTSVASSSVRTAADRGPIRVVSRFFPLPPQAASSRVVTDGKIPKRNCSGESTDDGSQRSKKKRPRQLTASEKKSDAYRRVFGNNTWEPPASCHRLLQERHSFDPWRVLMICILLNVTTGRQVEKVLPGLFLLCPDAEAATKVPEEEIEKVIQTLGLQKKRARMIRRFSCEYLRDDWTHVTQLHGIGKYAADAYAIFCAGKPEKVVPQDHKLIDYWKFVCGKRG